MCRQVAPSGSFARPAFTVSHAAAKTPSCLPRNRPSRMPSGSGWRKEFEGQPCQRHAGIGEGEERHDAVGDPWRETVFEVFERRVPAFFGAKHRDGKGQRDAGKCRVHAGFQHEDPHHDADQHVGCNPPDLQPVEDDQSDRGRAGPRQHRHRQVACVENRDDGDGAEVVDDRQRQQEHLERERHPVAEQRQHAEREGDVGRRRDRPAGRQSRLAPGHGEVDQRRHEHPADRRHAGQHQLLPRGELARAGSPA